MVKDKPGPLLFLFIDSYVRSLDFEATIATAMPMNAIIKNEVRKLVAPATKPINGGPTRKPRKPIVETAASATPGDMVFDLPAALYTSGTTDETPNPTNKNPMIAVHNVGSATASNRPDAVSKPLICKVLFKPTLLVNQSAINLPKAMVLINAV